MELGMVGLGRMGLNMAQRLLRAGHVVVGYDRDPAAIERAAALGIVPSPQLTGLCERMASPRALWLMVPAGEPVDEAVAGLLPQLREGDVLIDGGNSQYKDTVRRAALLAGHGVLMLDCGTSGGIWGLTEGYGLMIGGDERAVERLRPIFAALAPAPDRGWGRVGPAGAGHFVKMVHNGIEYGLMQAYAEGLAILEGTKAFDLDVHGIAEIWRHGTVIRSWLLDLVERALADNPHLDGIAPYVSDTGEGRWTVFEAIDSDVPAPVITLALLERLRSRQADSFADKLLAAMRNQFGGHAVRREG